MFKVPNEYRVREGKMASPDSYGNNGLFMIESKLAGKAIHTYRVIASDGDDWEHVSVSLIERTPTWDQMCEIKDLFWGKEDCVVQFHPPESEYVNYHPHCLHLWRKIGSEFETPPSYMVGPKSDR